MKLKQAECEKATRYFATQWFSGLSDKEKEHPSWLSFKEWLRMKGGADYLDFRSSTSADSQAEMWFDNELKQDWRN